MKKVGDEVGGYCPRCRLNVYLNVAATDGREVFTATCRTCHNTCKYQPEKDKEVLRAEALKKLARIRKRKEPRRAPEVVSRRKRVSEQSSVQVGAKGVAGAGPEGPGPPAATLPTGDEIANAASGATWGKPRKSIDLADAPANGSGEDPRVLWRKLTANLGPRDGSPYLAERTYAAGDVMLHKRHGMGIVESVVNENACMVVFRAARHVIEMAQAPGG